MKDLTGKTFGRLTVIKRAPDRIVPSGQHKTMWWCKCDCGNPNLIAVDAYSLTHHRTKSCGCIQKEVASEMFSNPNKYDLSGSYGIGYTSKEEKFYFDLEDYNKIKDYTWFIGTGNVDGYVVSNFNNKTILMHRIIMNYDGLNDIDHIHGKETRNDNRKCNLRIATRSQNNMNKGNANSNTGIIGIHKLKNDKFRAYIGVNKKNIILGDFERLEDAFAIRKVAEKQDFKDFRYDISQSCDKNY